MEVDLKYVIKVLNLTLSQKQLLNAICLEPTEHLYAKAYYERHYMTKGVIRAALQRLTTAGIVAQVDGVWRIKSTNLQRYWEKVLSGGDLMKAEAVRFGEL